MKQFFYDVTEVGWERLSNLGVGVFAAHVTTNANELVYGNMIPVVDVFVRRFYEFYFFFRIIDESAKFFLLTFTYLAAKQLVNLSLDVS